MLSGLEEADPWWIGSEFDCDGAYLIRIAFCRAIPYWEQHEMLCVGVYIQRRHDQIIRTLMENGHWPWMQHKEMALNEFEEFRLRVFWGCGPTTTIHSYGPGFLYRLICELERGRQGEERQGQRCLHLYLRRMLIENYPTFLDDFDYDVDDDDTSDFLSLITSNDSNERIPPLHPADRHENWPYVEEYWSTLPALEQPSFGWKAICMAWHMPEDDLAASVRPVTDYRRAQDRLPCRKHRNSLSNHNHVIY